MGMEFNEIVVFGIPERVLRGSATMGRGAQLQKLRS